MKVICIDASDGIYNVASLLLREGSQYNVTEYNETTYWVEGITFNPRTGKRIVFVKNRFIPLSEIDELELVNTNEELNNLKFQEVLLNN